MPQLRGAKHSVCERYIAETLAAGMMSSVMGGETHRSRRRINFPARLSSLTEPDAKYTTNGLNKPRARARDSDGTIHSPKYFGRLPNREHCKFHIV